MVTKPDEQVRRQMRANGLAYRARLLPELRGNGALWRARRGEAARDCGLKALDRAWTLDVMALRERFSADWSTLPSNRPIRGDPAGDDFARALDEAVNRGVFRLRVLHDGVERFYFLERDVP